MLRRALHRLQFGRDHRWAPPRASGYLDGDLTPGELTRMRRHLERCPQCRELVRSLQEIVAALGTMGGDEGVQVAGTVLASIKGRLADPTSAGG